MYKNLCNNFFKITRAKIKRIHIFVSLVLSLSTFCGTLTAFAEGFYQVRVVIDGKWHFYNTMGMKLSEFFEKENIQLFKKDIIDTNLSTVIDKDITVNINRAETVKIVIDNKKEVPFITNNRVIGIVLKEFEKETGNKVYLEEGQSSAAKL